MTAVTDAGTAVTVAVVWVCCGFVIGPLVVLLVGTAVGTLEAAGFADTTAEPAAINDWLNGGP